MTEKRQGSVLRAFVAAGLAYVLVLHAVLSATSLGPISLSFGPILPPSTSSAPARVTARPGHPCRPMASATHPCPLRSGPLQRTHADVRPRRGSERISLRQRRARARDRTRCATARARIVAAARTTHRGVITEASPRPPSPKPWAVILRGHAPIIGASTCRRSSPSLPLLGGSLALAGRCLGAHHPRNRQGFHWRLVQGRLSACRTAARDRRPSRFVSRSPTA